MLDQTEIAELYQEIILEHNKSPRNTGCIHNADCEAAGHNPLCGDKVSVYLKTENDRVEDVKFDGEGCAISIASASLMTEAIKNKSIDDAKNLFEQMRDMLIEKELPDISQLGTLQALAGVREFPMRIKCATLPWHTLKSALDHNKNITSTE